MLRGFRRVLSPDPAKKRAERQSTSTESRGSCLNWSVVRRLRFLSSTVASVPAGFPSSSSTVGRWAGGRQPAPPVLGRGDGPVEPGWKGAGHALPRREESRLDAAGSPAPYLDINGAPTRPVSGGTSRPIDAASQPPPWMSGARPGCRGRDRRLPRGNACTGRTRAGRTATH